MADNTTGSGFSMRTISGSARRYGWNFVISHRAHVNKNTIFFNAADTGLSTPPRSCAVNFIARHSPAMRHRTTQILARSCCGSGPSRPAQCCPCTKHQVPFAPANPGTRRFSRAAHHQQAVYNRKHGNFLLRSLRRTVAAPLVAFKER